MMMNYLIGKCNFKTLLKISFKNRAPKQPVILSGVLFSVADMEWDKVTPSEVAD